MNKEEATKLFTKHLAEAGYIYFIEDAGLESYVKEHSKFFYPVLKEGDLNKIRISGTAYHNSDYDRYDKNRQVEIFIKPKYPDDFLGQKSFLKDVINQEYQSVVLSKNKPEEDHLTKFHAEQTVIQNAIKTAKDFGANYLFVRCSGKWEHWSTYSFSLEGFLYAAIRDNEMNLLQNMYKGDLSKEAMGAAQALGIEKELEVDYKALAENDPEKFCRYFEAVSDKKRSGIIHDIWELLNDVDPVIKNVLRKKEYEQLLKDAGRDKIR